MFPSCCNIIANHHSFADYLPPTMNVSSSPEVKIQREFIYFPLNAKGMAIAEKIMNSTDEDAKLDLTLSFLKKLRGFGVKMNEHVDITRARIIMNLVFREKVLENYSWCGHRSYILSARDSKVFMIMKGNSIST